MSTEKSVLIIAPHFAPETHAAVFRAHKLAKYLPEHGWKPYVLTVDTNYTYNEDPGLLDELPAEVEIIRAGYIEPTVRGVRMALGGGDRTYATLKRSAGATPTVASSGELGSIGRSGILGRIYAHARRRWLASPDRYKTWEGPAIRRATQLMADHRIDLVFSTCPPLTAHQVARTAQGPNRPWVADFRDPSTYGRRYSSPLRSVERVQRNIVRETLARADAITTAGSSFELIFHDLYGKGAMGKFHWIPTGVDDELLMSNVQDAGGTEVNGTPYVIFVGEVMPDYGTEFFDYLASALDRIDCRHNLLIVGSEEKNRELLSPALSRSGLDQHTRFIDHVPQRELYRLILGAKAGVLAPGRFGYWWTLHAKLVDYVGLRKPVLAVVPDPSEARSVLTRARLGVFLDGPEPQAVQTLVDFLNDDVRLPKPNTEECDRYLASAQVRSFAELFDSLIER